MFKTNIIPAKYEHDSIVVKMLDVIQLTDIKRRLIRDTNPKEAKTL